MHDYVIRANFTTTPRLKEKLLRVCTCYAWLFYLTLLPWEFIYAKLRNLTILKRGLVKFARLT